MQMSRIAGNRHKVPQLFREQKKSAFFIFLGPSEFTQVSHKNISLGQMIRCCLPHGRHALLRAAKTQCPWGRWPALQTLVPFLAAHAVMKHTSKPLFGKSRKEKDIHTQVNDTFLKPPLGSDQVCHSASLPFLCLPVCSLHLDTYRVQLRDTRKSTSNAWLSSFAAASATNNTERKTRKEQKLALAGMIGGQGSFHLV